MTYSSTTSGCVGSRNPRQERTQKRCRADVCDSQSTEWNRNPALPVGHGSAKRPRQPGCEMCADDAAARYGGYCPQFGKDAELVQSPECAKMEERRTVVAARQAEPNSVPPYFQFRQILVRGVGRYANIACGQLRGSLAQYWGMRPTEPARGPAACHHAFDWHFPGAQARTSEAKGGQQRLHKFCAIRRTPPISLLYP